MPPTARNYYMGVIATAVFLLLFWNYYPSSYPGHPPTLSSSYRRPRKLRIAEFESDFHAIGRQKTQTGSPLEGPEIEHMGIGNRKENNNEVERGIDRVNEEAFVDIRDVEDLDMEDEEDDLDFDSIEGNEEWVERMNGGMKALMVKEESSEMMEIPGKKLPSKSMGKYDEVGRKSVKRYLIYLCDKSVKCSGFADRQRAIVGVYLMALATNRTFGIIMTQPAPIQDFYVPNKVNWIINPEELEGKSSIVLNCMPKRSKCGFQDLNADFPQDVIYIRSKNDFLHILGKLGNYRQNLPYWALGSNIVTFGHAWMTLMKPRNTLRDDINSLLLDVARDMQQDVKIIPKILKTDSCLTACKEVIMLEQNLSQSTDKCFDVLDNLKNVEQRGRVNFFRHICPVQAAIMPPPLDTIKAATGFDYVNLELVCAQVRLGKGLTLKREPELNKMKDTVLIWNILRPYINKGHHMFLASDSQEVRDKAKELFGSRVHVNSDPIVHINKVERNVDAWRGMKTALMEQLFLSTSCKVLVYSHTGFGTRSAMVRHVINRGKEGFTTYIFYRGRVNRVNFDVKPPLLPVRKHL